MTVYTVGIDPPHGWGIFGEQGPLAVGHGGGRKAEDKMEQALERLLSVADRIGGPPLLCYVEQPFGVQASFLSQSMLEDARLGGIIEDRLRSRLWVVERPLPNTVRAMLGLPRRGKKLGKELALRLATKMVSDSGTMAGAPPSHHAAEGLLMAAAAWEQSAGGGVMRAWRETGFFRSTTPTPRSPR